MVVELVGAFAVLLVEPVRRDAVLRRAMHVAGTDLDLVQLPARPEHRGVERLIAVRLGTRDVILDALLQRRPGVVDDPQDVVAVGDAVDEHADREEIVDFLERLAALLHLLEDRPEILGPADNLPARDPRALQSPRRAVTASVRWSGPAPRGAP